MKNSVCSFAGILLLAILSFSSCKKVAVTATNPTLTSDAKTLVVPILSSSAFNLNISVMPVSATCFSIGASVKNNGGNVVNANIHSSLTVIVTNPDGTVNAGTPYIYDAIALQANGGMQFSNFQICGDPGTYTINICSNYTPPGRPSPVNICTTITYVLVGECTLNPVTLNGHAYDIGLADNGLPNGEINAAFNVSVCSGTYSALKLQGGLVSGATAPSGVDAINNPMPTSPWAYISPDITGSAYDGNDDVNTLTQVKKLNSNWTITWAISSATAGYSKDYIIRYHKNLLPGTNFVTGAWSLKSNSILVAGYTDRLTISY